MAKINLVGIANEIAANDTLLGMISRECIACGNDGRYLAGLACIFIMLETALKRKIDQPDKSLKQLLAKARNDKFLSEREFLRMDSIRQLRNSIFHRYEYFNGMMYDGVFWPFSEDETKEQLFKEIAPFSFKVILKLSQ